MSAQNYCKKLVNPIHALVNEWFYFCLQLNNKIVAGILFTLNTWLYIMRLRMLAAYNKNARLSLRGKEKILAEIKKIFKKNQSLIIWMHCESIGEYEQGLPLLQLLKKQFPLYKIIVTFFSAEGYEAKKNDNAADYIFYLPFNYKKNAQEFINVINPKIVLWIKHKHSFFYVEELKKRNISSLLIAEVFNSSQSYFKWYGNLQRLMLKNYTHFFVQDENSKTLLSTINIIQNVIVSGDTRFDRVIEIANQFTPILLIEEFCGINNPVIVAGSTWEEDEEEMDHYANTHPEIKFIIAPHNLDEEHLQNIKKLFKNSIYFSELTEAILNIEFQISNNAAHVLIIDNIGMLSQLYKYATITYVGGGFVDDGVHNVLEAAVYGKPVVFGPVIDDYIEAIELVDCGGGIVVDNALEMEKTFNRLLINAHEYIACCEAAKNYVYSKKGAAEIIINHIQEKRLLTN